MHDGTSCAGLVFEEEPLHEEAHTVRHGELSFATPVSISESFDISSLQEPRQTFGLVTGGSMEVGERGHFVSA